MDRRWKHRHRTVTSGSSHTHTCHVAVDFEGAKGSTTIRIDPVGFRGPSQMLVRLTRWLIDSWGWGRGKEKHRWEMISWREQDWHSGFNAPYIPDPLLPKGSILSNLMILSKLLEWIKQAYNLLNSERISFLWTPICLFYVVSCWEVCCWYWNTFLNMISNSAVKNAWWRCQDHVFVKLKSRGLILILW